jgi:hypothetical protein
MLLCATKRAAVATERVAARMASTSSALHGELLLLLMMLMLPVAVLLELVG